MMKSANPRLSGAEDTNHGDPGQTMEAIGIKIEGATVKKFPSI